MAARNRRNHWWPACVEAAASSTRIRPADQVRLLSLGDWPCRDCVKQLRRRSLWTEKCEAAAEGKKEEKEVKLVLVKQQRGFV